MRPQGSGSLTLAAPHGRAARLRGPRTTTGRPSSTASAAMRALDAETRIRALRHSVAAAFRRIGVRSPSPHTPTLVHARRRPAAPLLHGEVCFKSTESKSTESRASTMNQIQFRPTETVFEFGAVTPRRIRSAGRGARELTRPPHAVSGALCPANHRPASRALPRRRDGTLCIGVAASASNLPTGPFADALGAPLPVHTTPPTGLNPHWVRSFGSMVLGQPLLCRPDGAIDPHVFIDRRGDDATPHLLWKDDSNARGARTTIFLQRLRADGLGLEGAPKPLLSNDPAGWEGPLVEVSSLVLDVSISAAFRLHLDCISAAGSLACARHLERAALLLPILLRQRLQWAQVRSRRP